MKRQRISPYGTIILFCFVTFLFSFSMLSCSQAEKEPPRVILIGDVTLQSDNNARNARSAQPRQGQQQRQQGQPQQGQPGQMQPQAQGQRQQGQPQQGFNRSAAPAQPTGTGWGAFFGASIDSEKAQTSIIAGTNSSRSFYNGQWKTVKESLSKGDYIVIQFGHYDSLALVPTAFSRIGGSLPGTGDETEIVSAANNTQDTVHTYGWYLKSIINEAKALGIKTIICSPVPRNLWKDGKIERSSTYAAWAKEVAESTSAAFIDLNEIMASAYDQLGEASTKALFVDQSDMLTNEDGAYLTGKNMFQAVKDLKKVKLAQLLRPAYPSIEEMATLRAQQNIRKSITPNLVQSPAVKKKYTKISANLSARQMEFLDRGLVGIRKDDGNVFLSWRMLGTEPSSISFNIYKQVGEGAPTKLNDAPIDKVTWYLDSQVDSTQMNSWYITAIVDGQESEASKKFTLEAFAPARPYLSIPLQTIEGYSPSDASAADLDGDGEYEIVVKQEMRGYDNSQRGVCPGTTKLEAYKLDGTFMWRIDLGPNIREGAHYTQFMVFDFDGDGKAEVICKTSEGTTDGVGTTIGDTDGDGITCYVDSTSGYILDGPEFFSVFEGTTGKELARENYIARGPKEEWNKTWGDTYGNRIDRFLAGVGYFDGTRPSVLLCRGYYSRAVLEAWNWRDGKLTRVWRFDTDDTSNKDNVLYRGQGNHNLSIADVDNDGKDEVIYGSCAIDHDGTGLYTTQLRHGDALHVSDLDPDRPGLEVFQPHESYPNTHGIEFRDARTGESLWGSPSTADIGRGLAIDIDPNYRGSECWGSGMALFSAKGEKISDKTPGSTNFAVWWDGDLLRELLDRNTVSKWDGETKTTNPIMVAENCRSNNGTKATPNLSADILGDWREEVILATTDNQELRIFTTTIPTDYRFYTFMHDFVYRLGIAWQNTAYNQPPHVSFFVGDGPEAQPQNKIYYAQ